LTSDISASTVARSEMRAGAGLIASAQFFYQQMLANLKQMTEASWAIVLHAYRQDATNGHKKLCALEMESCYLIATETSGSISWNQFHHIKRLADLIQVGDETGAGCVGATLQAMQSLGCPSWRDVREQMHLAFCYRYMFVSF